MQIAEIRRQYERDRFVQRSPISARELVALEGAVLESAHALGFETVALSLLAPLGLHHVLGGTPQNNVLATGRGTEVAADPTNVLALEAAARRADLVADASTRAASVQLATTQRVTRAQYFDGPRSFAHFLIFGMLTAGRDTGDFRFELSSLVDQISLAVQAVRALTQAPIMIRLTPFNPDLHEACEALCAQREQPDVQWQLWPDREHGRGYYQNVGFKLDVLLDSEVFEIGDGGDVPWMAELLQSRKERTVIGGLGLERLAMLVAESGPKASATT